MEQNAKFVVRLDEAERGRLQEMVDRGEGSKTIRNRALILLKADEGEGGPAWTDAKIAEAFGVGVRTAERTRRLLVVEGFEAVLARKPSPNRQYRKRDGAREAELVKLACSKPPAGRVRWTFCSCWPTDWWNGTWCRRSGARRCARRSKKRPQAVAP